MKNKASIKTSARHNFLELWSHISGPHRKKLVLLLALMLFASIVEVISIGAVIPFLGALTAPKEIFSHQISLPIIDFFNTTTPQEFSLLLTVLFVIAALVSGMVRVALLWSQTKVGHSIGADLSKSMYKRTLFQPYEMHIVRNSSEIISGISVKSSQIVTNILMPTFIIIGSVLMLTMILAFLVVMNPVIAIYILILFGLFYLFIVLVVKRRLTVNSEIMSGRQNEVIKALQEGLGGIRDVLLDGTQHIYCKVFNYADLELRKAQADNQIIGGSPRYVIESIIIALIAILALYLVKDRGGIEFAIPVLGALALGAQRVLPLLQQIFQSWSSIRGSQGILEDIIELLNQDISRVDTLQEGEVKFEKNILLSMVSYRYKRGPWILRDLSLNIKKGDCVGFIGTTGSGKSTLLDVVMSLLSPKQGSLIVDGQKITPENQHMWQKGISHVPQHVFLSDSTIAENIAFGVPYEHIDFDRVKSAAKDAVILKDIEVLDNGFNTVTGENGVQLSGGQRQRIGIARALYKKSDLIILDEATSALDDKTELSVMSTINKKSEKKTVLIIAHRLTTLKKCNVIHRLDKGAIVESGTYDEIVNNIRKKI